jgi:hypothetical protein
MATDTLNWRQQEIRKVLIRTKCSATTAELADQFQVSRNTVQCDRRAIREHAPIRGLRTGDSNWNEGVEIGRAHAAYDALLAEVNDELERAEQEIEARHGQPVVASFSNARATLLDQKRKILADRLAFDLGIGYFTPATRRIHLETEEVSSLRGTALDEECDRLDGVLGPDPCGRTGRLFADLEEPPAGSNGGRGMAPPGTVGLKMMRERQTKLINARAKAERARGGPGADRAPDGRFRPGRNGKGPEAAALPPNGKGGNGKDHQ